MTNQINRMRGTSSLGKAGVAGLSDEGWWAAHAKTQAKTIMTKECSNE